MILPNEIYAVLIKHNGQTKLDSHLFKNKEKALEYAKNRVKNLAGKHITIETVTHTYWTKKLDPTKKLSDTWPIEASARQLFTNLKTQI